MTTHALIITVAADLHAAAAGWALQRCGATVHEWIVTDFPEQAALSLDYGVGIESSARIGDWAFDVADSPFDAVWNRRWIRSANLPSVHPDDRKFASDECLSALTGALDLVAPEAFWVNPALASRQAAEKTRQLRYASGCGLTIPDTLITNDPARLRAFAERHGGQVIYKSMNNMAWMSADGASRTLYTTALYADDLANDAALRLCPGLYQPNIKKDHEVRATFIGETCYAARIDSQSMDVAAQDWRRAPLVEGENGAFFARTELPETVEDGCRNLMRALGLVFGAFDFIVTPTGEYVFLEVNEMGQFLSFDRDADLPVLQAFCDLLLTRDPTFRRRNGWRDDLRMAAFYDSDAYAAFREDPLQGHLADARAVAQLERGDRQDEAAEVVS